MIDNIHDPKVRLKMELQQIRSDISTNILTYHRQSPLSIHKVPGLDQATPSALKVQRNNSDKKFKNRHKSVSAVNDVFDKKSRFQGVTIDRLVQVNENYKKMDKIFNNLDLERKMNRVSMQQ